MGSPAAFGEVSAAVGAPFVVVDLSGPTAAAPGSVDRAGGAARGAAGLPVVVVGAGRDGPGGLPAPVADLFDLVVADPEPVVATVEGSPQAAVTLVQVLRASLSLPVPVALAAESSAYSMLQSGPEFARWRAAAQAYETPAAAAGVAPPVVVERTGDRLHLTLNRPGRHNAVNADMREQLVAALLVACADPTVGSVILDGAGPSFCSGGDLAEFGTRPDPVTAHLVRLTRCPARLLAELAARLEVRLHGATIGAGLEMAAFARRVVAHPDTVLSLPEIGLGLIPGAGGTVSVPRRIGRHRTAELALAGGPIDVRTALRWGLVDAVER